ncbi:uncharacterized protein BDCG_05033 [Blastomyces dermatitidis ER-3]|uniref:Cytochrome b561 domain-containing protein n=1 Tax=Ajellomyces dermatitidis (strain ER-3 / ATCC MYA-2586) TaxID=559297 RepID=A0ABX2VW40_AJEDR|nr:uncharacterized protein BDCG_05033 [Blastomyces dermatitidis ER-3]OAT01375.1 hypothetical protein BDCG_05033 [Blastomyces dermatitidis ER-3]
MTIGKAGIATFGLCGARDDKKRESRFRLGSHDRRIAIGIRVGKILDRLHAKAHTILRTAIIALLLLQPLIGFVNHHKFTRTQRPGLWTRFHVWYGRVLILLGMINGGLLVQLADNTRAGIVAYGVVAGLVGVVYYTTVAFFENRKWRHRDDAASDVELEERSKSPTPCPERGCRVLNLGIWRHF